MQAYSLRKVSEPNEQMGRMEPPIFGDLSERVINHSAILAEQEFRQKRKGPMMQQKSLLQGRVSTQSQSTVGKMQSAKKKKKAGKLREYTSAIAGSRIFRVYESLAQG